MYKVMIPTRCKHIEEARRKHGHRLDLYVRYLMKPDPIADEVVAAFSKPPPGTIHRTLTTALDCGIDAAPDAPEPLRALFARLDEVPFWVDWRKLEIGGKAFLRTGIFGSFALACGSLPLAYSCPAGNKPLTFSGQLVSQAARRISETGRFIIETCKPGGLRRFSPGFKITVMIRMMHAQVRHLLKQSPAWNTTAWGEPINQADMAATNLLFSVVLMDGLRRMGFRFSRKESEGLMQLWRYSGYLIGLDPDLTCATEDEGRQLMDIVSMVSEDPDEDSHDLVKALIESAVQKAIGSTVFLGDAGQKVLAASWVPDFCYGLSRTLLGDKLADGLRFPKNAWRFASILAIKALIYPLETVRPFVPRSNDLAVSIGTKLICKIMDAGLSGTPPDFHLPDQLEAYHRMRN